MKLDPSTLIMADRPSPGAAEGGTMLAGRYLMGEVIGRGGMSTVYRARDTVLDRDVAVKVLLSSLAEADPAHVARFEREARAAGSLRHPAVVKIFDTGQDGSTHFIVMELVSGVSLAQVLADGRSLDPERAARIASGVAGALAAAHTAGILHRDVKPANVMVTPGGQVKVLDFGIARGRDDPTLTQTAFAIGTGAYMSPERINGLPGDERSDVYSLGCLLYAMLTGRPPFVADDVLSVLHQQVHGRPIPPSRHVAEISPALDGLVLAMLAKDPAARPQSASAVAARLADKARSVPAAPGLAISRYRASPRGRPLAALVLAGTVALLLILVAVGGGPSRPGQASAASGHRTAARTRSARTSTTRRQVTLPVSAPKDAHPTPPGQGGGPPGHGGVPPGHGGVPPGQQKKDHGPGGGPPQSEGDGGD